MSKRSKDYKRLKELLDIGRTVTCFFDLHTGGSPYSHIAKKEVIPNGKNMIDAYNMVGYWTNQTEEAFIRGCESFCVEFIDEEMNNG
jgi:hypothetical protein